MKYKVKVTVIDKKLHPQLQEKYCADPNSEATEIALETAWKG